MNLPKLGLESMALDFRQRFRCHQENWWLGSPAILRGDWNVREERFEVRLGSGMLLAR